MHVLYLAYYSFLYMTMMNVTCLEDIINRLQSVVFNHATVSLLPRKLHVMITKSVCEFPKETYILQISLRGVPFGYRFHVPYCIISMFLHSKNWFKVL